AAAGYLEQVVSLGRRDAPLDVPNRLLETPDARQRHPERVVGMSRHLRRRAVALRHARRFRARAGGGLPDPPPCPLARTRARAPSILSPAMLRWWPRASRSSRRSGCPPTLARMARPMCP